MKVLFSLFVLSGVINIIMNVMINNAAQSFMIYHGNEQN